MLIVEELKQLTPRDVARLEREAKDGNKAALKLGICYLLGIGGKLEDRAKAAELFNASFLYATDPNPLERDDYDLVHNLYECARFGVHSAQDELFINGLWRMGSLGKFGNEVDDLLVQAAEQGHSTAKCILASKKIEHMQKLTGYPIGPTELNDLYMEAAKAGYAPAQCIIAGWMLTQNNIKEAEKFFNEAAEKGYINAQFFLGHFYLDEQISEGTVAQDVQKATQWFRLAAAQGSEQAKIEILKIGAKGGDCDAQYELGKHYLDRRDRIAENERDAVELFRLAAEKGHAGAQYELGVCYFHGIYGVTKDEHEAVRLFSLAAEKNHVKAQGLLGYCLHEGIGTLKNVHEGIYWLNRAVDQGDPFAEYVLGYYCSHSGEGIDIDADKAVRLLRSAMGKGNMHAQYEYALCLGDGRGVAKDEFLARKLLEQALEKGVEGGLRTALGTMIAEGQGGLKDVRRAYSLFKDEETPAGDTDADAKAGTFRTK